MCLRLQNSVGESASGDIDNANTQALCESSAFLVVIGAPIRPIKNTTPFARQIYAFLLRFVGLAGAC